MKKYILLQCIGLFLFFNSHAQIADYKIVFDITSNDSSSQQAVVREVKLIKTANPDAKLEVVVYGQGLNLVLKDKSSQAAAIQNLLTYNNVSFKVCAITLERNHIDKSNLVQGVEVVPDGIYEIYSKQKEGWGYIKVAH